MPDSETILARAQKLDPQALALLHDELYPVVYRFVFFRLDDAQVCEDITAEVFLRLIETFKKPNSQIQDARAWLLGTASHLVMDHMRNKYRRPVEPLENQENRLQDGTSPERAAEDTMHFDQVRSVMGSLSADQQTVLALRFSQDCSLEETARLMGKTIGAVKVLQFRALEKLRRKLEERWKE